MAEPRRPHPAADALTAPFWMAAREGRLVIQCCGACGTWQHPPATRCHRCGESERLAWTPVSGDALVLSWTRVEQGLVAGFEQVVPYLVVIVELAEQPGLYLLTDVPGAHPWALRGPRVGEPVRVMFQEIDDTLSLPQFRPVGDPR